MSDTGSISTGTTRRIESQLATVATQLHELVQANAATQAKLDEVKDRLVSDQRSLEKDVRDLRDELRLTQDTVAALKSRQAPLSTPAAWIGLVVSGILAVKTFIL